MTRISILSLTLLAAAGCDYSGDFLFAGEIEGVRGVDHLGELVPATIDGPEDVAGAAIFGEITISDGQVEQTNFDRYPLLRLHQAPDVTVDIIESGKRIYGVGEAGTPTAAPALGNALFAATGERILFMITSS